MAADREEIRNVSETDGASTTRCCVRTNNYESGRFMAGGGGMRLFMSGVGTKYQPR